MQAESQSNTVVFDEWVFFAFVDGGPAGEVPRLFFSQDFQTLQEPGGYNSQTVPIGTPTAVGTGHLRIGASNSSTPGREWTDELYLVSLYSKRMTVAEIGAQLRSPHPTDDCVGFWRFGTGECSIDGRTIDQSGYGADTVVNSGTLALTTVDPPWAWEAHQAADEDVGAVAPVAPAFHPGWASRANIGVGFDVAA